MAFSRKGRSRTVRRLRRIGWSLVPPMTFVAIVGLWAGSVHIFNIPAYLLPGPGAVFHRMFVDAGMLWANAQVTLMEIVLGFGLTVVAAIPLGLLIALSPLVFEKTPVDMLGPSSASLKPLPPTPSRKSVAGSPRARSIMRRRRH